jgi:hypothetical protein
LCMIAVWLLGFLWWVQAIRFLFPGFVLLLGFATIGILTFWHRHPRLRLMLLSATVLMVGFNASFFCLYTYGSCNAWFDRTVGVLPGNLGLSAEGFHTFDQAREYLNRNAEPGAIIEVSTAENVSAWQTGVFRSDIRVVAEDVGQCPAWRIDQVVRDGGKIVYQTTDAPVTYVTVRECRVSE